jgi:putative FmdB family regulatory protein
MPIYEYECNKCGAAFDCIVMRVSEKYTARCTTCGSLRVRKCVSRVRYAAGPREDTLASSAEHKLLKSMGGNVNEQTRKEIRELSRQAAKRGKRRFDSMLDTGKSENIEY